MLVELPSADEIDALAITTPSFEVREFDFDMGSEIANLDYKPCKGQIVVVVMGERGIILTRCKGQKEWDLPTGRIGSTENPINAAKRVAREKCGVMLRSLELAGMYDVVWHYSDISVKRLHLIYAAITEDDIWAEGRKTDEWETRFFRTIPGDVIIGTIARHAIDDCSEE